MERAALSADETHHRGIGADDALGDSRGDGKGGGFAPFARRDSAHAYSLQLAVGGMHCAACIKRIESTLLAEEGVIAARVNMSTHRLALAWQGARDRGDALAAAVMRLGYTLTPLDAQKSGAQNRDEEKRLLLCIAVAGFAAGNIMLLSVGLWSTTIESMGLFTRTLLHWISAAIALPVILFAGRPFFASAYKALRAGHTNMDVPISVALILTSGISLFETRSGGAHAYFDSAVMLLFFLLVGRYLDARARGRARQSAAGLLARLGGVATVLSHDGKTELVPVGQLREGMTVLVAMGETIPADGVITAGESEMDMSLITGETLPQTAKKGMAVFAGTVNIAAPLRIRIKRAGEQSLLAGIVRLMEQAEQGASRYVRLADRAASLYTPVVHILGAATFLGWWLIIGAAWQQALLTGVTVLIITCPCAMGLAVPVVQVLASGKLLRRGIILKSGDALERLAAINVAVFDKTGTLTGGTPALDNSGAHGAGDLRLAASLAAHSRHPLSQALCRAYGGKLHAFENIRELPGKGLAGIHKGAKYRLGSRAWCGEGTAADDASMELWLAPEGRAAVRFTFSDALRSDAPDVIKTLQAEGIKTVLLSGDRAGAVAEAAEAAGIAEYHAALTPEEKCRHLESLKAAGGRVLMVGDGLNDAPSLAVADVSVSPSTAMDITRNAADVVFQGEGLSAVLLAWRVARQSVRLVKQNLALATLYNMIAIPLAVLGQVTPLIAAIAMSLSSLVVIGNGFRLNRRQ